MSEISDTAVLVKLGGEGTYFLIKGAVKGIMHLYQTLKKMNAAKILGDGQVEDFEKFLKATEGQYKILNIPTEDSEEIAKMKEDLDKLHIGYTVLPDLNVGDGKIQLAYAIADTDKVESWYRSFCLDKLQAGGEKSYQDLMNFTDGQISIVNIPWPDADISEEGLAEEFDKLKNDLRRSKFVYPEGIMPDLNTADRHIQIAVPSYHAQDMRDWYAYYAECPKDEIAIETIDDYLRTGAMDEYDYVDTASKDLNNKLQLVKKPDQEQARTEGQSRPLEVPQGEVRLKEDLDNLHINYTILPDLHVGDGYVQIAFATADAPKLKAWYEAYQNDMLAAGMPVNAMKEMTLDDYINTGKAGRQDEHIPETIPHKKPDSKNQNRFNNFEPRAYSSDFFESLERASLEHPKSSFEQTLDRMDGNNKQFVQELDTSVNNELVPVGQPIEIKAMENGEVMFVAQVPETENYYTGIADVAVQKEDGTFGDVAISRNKDVTIVSRDGKFLRSAKISEIMKAAMEVDEPVKVVHSTVQKMAEKLLQGPKL